MSSNILSISGVIHAFDTHTHCEMTATMTLLMFIITHGYHVMREEVFKAHPDGIFYVYNTKLQIRVTMLWDL